MHGAVWPIMKQYYTFITPLYGRVYRRSRWTLQQPSKITVRCWIERRGWYFLRHNICTCMCPSSNRWLLAYLLWLTLDGVEGKAWAWRERGRHVWRQRLVGVQLYVAIRQQISSVSVVSGTFVMWFVFSLQGPWDLAKPFPRHICFCVVTRDRDGDAVISGPDFSSTSPQLVSLPFLSLSVYLSICLSWRKAAPGGAKCHGSGSEREKRRSEKLRWRKREKLFTLLSWWLCFGFSPSHMHWTS